MAPPLDVQPVALDGFCPVELLRSERWVPGDRRWATVYRGQAYHFAGQIQRQQFLADPSRYVPAYAGEDPVLIVEEGRHVAGQTDYCVTYEGQLHMFSSQATLGKFQNDPRRYTGKGKSPSRRVP